MHEITGGMRDTIAVLIAVSVFATYALALVFHVLLRMSYCHHYRKENDA